MTKKSFRKRQKRGIFLIVLGSLLFLFIFLFLYLNVILVRGFPEFLPIHETVAYIEFPVTLNDDEMLISGINTMFRLNWEAAVRPWAGEKAAVAFLKSNSADQMIPLLLIQTHSVEKAFEFMKNFRNPKGIVTEYRVGYLTAFKTAAFHFSFLSDLLVISFSDAGLEKLLTLSSPLNAHLSQDREFITIHKNINAPFFAYLKLQKLPQRVFALIAERLPQMPILTLPFPTLGIGTDGKDGTWQGSSYATFPQHLTQPVQNQPYRARLLPFLPPDARLMLAGQNPASYLASLDTLLENSSHQVPSALLTIFTEQYLPGLDFTKDITPVLRGEFAFTIEEKAANAGRGVLFVNELTDPSLLTTIETIRSAFQKGAGQFTPAVREVTLPDGTSATELIPDASRIKTIKEEFEKIEIHGLLSEDDFQMYDAVTQEKWFVSNDLSTLKKALLRTKEPGANFRESSRYRATVQPVLKNPDVLGFAAFQDVIFGFSKKIFADHMETNFKIVVE